MPSNQDLYEKIGGVMAEVKFMSKAMDEMKPKIEKIETYISKQKGIIAGVGVIAGGVGAILSHLFK